MSAKSVLFVVALVGASAAWAQTSTAPTPPPLVPVAPPPMPAPEPGAAPATLQPMAPLPTSAAQPGTPPPPAATAPSYVPGSPSYVPGTQPSYPGYPYSPYGAPMGREKPSPEVGPMISESLFGMLTAAGCLILPYVLFSLAGVANDGTFGNVILIALMVAAPMATAQTQVGIANGSAYYQVESWIPLIAGLLGDALVFLTYSAWNNSSFPNSGFFNAPPVLFGTSDGRRPDPLIYLLVAASVGVPLLQMAAINLFKQPKFKAYAMNYDPKKGLEVGMPMPMPIVSQTGSGPSVGIGLSLLRGSF